MPAEIRVHVPARFPPHILLHIRGMVDYSLIVKASFFERRDGWVDRVLDGLVIRGVLLRGAVREDWWDGVIYTKLLGTGVGRHRAGQGALAW